MDAAAEALQSALLTAQKLSTAECSVHEAMRAWLMQAVARPGAEGECRDESLLAETYCKSVLFPALCAATDALVSLPLHTERAGRGLAIEDIRVLYTAVELLWLMFVEPSLAALHKTTLGANQPFSVPKTMFVTEQMVREIVPLSEKPGGEKAKQEKLFRVSLSAAALIVSHWQLVWAILQTIERLCTHSLVCQMILPRNISRVLCGYFSFVHLLDPAASHALALSSSLSFDTVQRLLRRFLSLTLDENDSDSAFSYPGQQLIDKATLVKNLRLFTNHPVQCLRQSAASYMTELLLSPHGLLNVIRGFLEDNIESAHLQQIQAQLAKIVVSVPQRLSASQYFAALCPQLVSLVHFYALSHSNSDYQMLSQSVLHPETTSNSDASVRNEGNRVSRHRKAPLNPDNKNKSNAPSHRETQQLLLFTLALIVWRIAQLHPAVMRSLVLERLAEPLLCARRGEPLSEDSLYARAVACGRESDGRVRVRQGVLCGAAPLRECVHVLCCISTLSPSLSFLAQSFFDCDITLSLLHLKSALDRECARRSSAEAGPDREGDLHALLTSQFVSALTSTEEEEEVRESSTPNEKRYLLDEQTTTSNVAELALLQWMSSESVHTLQRVFCVSHELAKRSLLVFLGECVFAPHVLRGVYVFSRSMSQGNGAFLEVSVQRVDRSLSFPLSVSPSPSLPSAHSSSARSPLISVVDNNINKPREDQQQTQRNASHTAHAQGSRQELAALVREIDAMRMTEKQADSEAEMDGERALQTMSKRLSAPLESVLSLLRESDSPVSASDKSSSGVAREKRDTSLRGLSARVFLAVLGVHLRSDDNNMWGTDGETEGAPLSFEERAFYGMIVFAMQHSLPAELLLCNVPDMLSLLVDVLSSAMRRLLHIRSLSSPEKVLVQSVAEERGTAGVESVCDLLLIALPLAREVVSHVLSLSEERGKEESDTRSHGDADEDVSRSLSRLRQEIAWVRFHCDSDDETEAASLSPETRSLVIELCDEITQLTVRAQLSESESERDAEAAADEKRAKSLREIFDEVRREHWTPRSVSLSLLPRPVALAFGVQELEKRLNIFLAEEWESLGAPLLLSVLALLCTNDVFLSLRAVRLLARFTERVSLAYRARVLALFVRIFSNESTSTHKNEDDLEGITIDSISAHSLLLLPPTQSTVVGGDTGAEDEDFARVESNTRLRVLLGEVLVQLFSRSRLRIKGVEERKREQDLRESTEREEEEPQQAIDRAMLTALRASLVLARTRLSAQAAPLAQFDAFSGKRVSTKKEQIESDNNSSSLDAARSTPAEKESVEVNEEAAKLDELYLRQSSLSLLSVLVPQLSVTTIHHFLRDMLDIAQGIVSFERGHHPVTRACRRSAIAFICYLLENNHEQLFVHYGGEGFEYLTTILRFLKQLHVSVDEKDDVVKFQTERALKIMSSLAKDYLGPQDELPEEIKFLRIVKH